MSTLQIKIIKLYLVFLLDSFVVREELKLSAENQWR